MKQLGFKFQEYHHEDQDGTIESTQPGEKRSTMKIPQRESISPHPWIVQLAREGRLDFLDKTELPKPKDKRRG